MQTSFELRRGSSPTVFVIGDTSSTTNRRLRDAFAATGLPALVGSAQRASEWARHGDIVLGRLDVRPTLDGVQPGLGRMLQVRKRGIRVVNDAHSLIASHDKLTTMLLLRAADVPHPHGAHLTDAGTSPIFEPPYVVKPRYGSWGRDVHRCESRAELRTCLRAISGRPWFRRHGALVQELIPPRGFDLRLIVSAGEVVGAIERVAAPGEWRTNIALGGHRRRATPTADACALAARAAAAIGGDLVGVDLLPDGGGWRVIEINGAVDFTDEYALDGGDVFARAVESLVGDAAVSVPALSSVAHAGIAPAATVA